MLESNHTVLDDYLSHSKKQPDQLAIFSEHGQVTYSQLTKFANACAILMKERGLGYGEFVSIELPRQWQYLGLCIASWICGGAFIALGSELPKERRDYIAKNCNAKLRIDIACLEDFEREIQSRALYDYPFEECELPDINDPAFAVYTSGSTGYPKGMVHNHHSLLLACQRHNKLAHYSDTNNWATISTFSFVTGLITALAAIVYGSSFYIIPDNIKNDINLVADFTSQYDINMMFLPPALIPYFRQKKNTIRKIFTGSERVINVHSDEFEIINCWGSSETCSAVLYFIIDKEYENTPIGFPICDEKEYILDENNNEVEEGELCVSGHMATEYIGLSEESTKVFQPNPFKNIDEYDVIIHSGDIVKRLSDGNIVYLDRADWEVNVSGHRIDPGEISAHLSLLPQIKRCEVIGFEKKDNEVALCVYYQVTDSVSEENIRTYLAESLPEYMIPEKFILTNELPLLPNGKVDRNALNNPFSENDVSSFPDDEIVESIVKTLEKCSGRSDYKYDEDLAKAGISSLTTIRLLAELEDKMGVSISPSDIANGCSIKSISEIIKQKQ